MKRFTFARCKKAFTRVTDRLHLFMAREKRYFKEDKRTIAANNLSMLVTSTIAALVLIVLLFGVSYITITNWQPTVYHLLMFIMLSAFFAFSIWYRAAAAQPNYKVISFACKLFCILVIANIAAVSIFPYPRAPEALMSLGLMAVPIIFTLPYGFTSLLLILSEAAFLVVAYMVKSPASMEHDGFSTIAATMFSLIVTWCVLTVRMADFAVRAKYQRRSRTDQLTGILNKSGFTTECSAYLRTFSKVESCAMFVIDADNFKTVNDTYGHETGDRLLEIIGAALLKTFRQSDIIGRFGGDEFCVMMKDIESAKSAANKAIILQKLVHEMSRETIGQEISCSIGIAVSEKKECTYNALFKLGDEALYTSKDRGKNCATILTLK